MTTTDPANQHGTVSYAPLPLFTTGASRIVPFQDGQMLQVGRDYLMVAIPKRGYVFTNWQPVNEFHYTITTIDDNGATNPPITSTVISLVPPSSTRPVLRFTMQPEIVIVDIPGTLKITESSGRQANFVPAEGAHSTETSRGTKILNDAHNGPEPDNPRQPKNPPHSFSGVRAG